MPQGERSIAARQALFIKNAWRTAWGPSNRSALLLFDDQREINLPQLHKRRGSHIGRLLRAHLG